MGALEELGARVERVLEGSLRRPESNCNCTWAVRLVLNQGFYDVREAETQPSSDCREAERRG